MNRGIYPPLAGAITLERRLEVLSHNIGNVQTTGFKKDKPIFATILGQTSGPSVAGIDLFPLIGALAFRSLSRGSVSYGRSLRCGFTRRGVSGRRNSGRASLLPWWETPTEFWREFGDA